MLSDTVGFVADLPHDLVAAFRATLEEVVDADIILHVRDIANPDHSGQAQDVLKVLDELGVSSETTPIIEVWNKIDLLGETGLSLAGAAPAGKVLATMAVSAHTGQGLQELRDLIEKSLGEQSRTYHVHVPHSAGSDIGWLHNNAEVISRDEPTEKGQDYVVRVDPRHKTAFLERFNGRIALSDL
jgi:GTP-binding protein HflX